MSTCSCVGGQIPDASLIHLARKRRQLARERGDEFIPIDSGNAAHEKKSSRLIRWWCRLDHLWLVSLLLNLLT